ncbi:GNAT family N-acetyltransferase [Lacticaseibacillus camelliae]|uniref:N-acetyltransferase domain-containing protein n=1 Tax=Lacticaseibacillus camelliae DSM 22697 = JCM 13995 TaxID=1423730 RepID=A0A0R2FBY8_9LACO|nr:GNAT family N-acetyltransferase [Lacticaseibacillus camelliae]KRN25923.1 hypothetical protein FC75_GL002058 [Lacticaseibacillus camelliae DSM 22697 = JCM 13995]
MFKFHAVRTPQDRQTALKIYQSNPSYFTLTGQKAPTLQMVREDAEAYPADVSETQKHYGLLLINSTPVGVMDRLNGYPEPQTVYIGLLMIDAAHQRQGLGRRAVDGFAKQFQRQGYGRMRVAVHTANPAALQFWQQVGFKPVGEGRAQLSADQSQPVVILDRDLAD